MNNTLGTTKFVFPAPLSKGNWFTWSEFLYEILNSFGHAGEEVRTKTPKVLEEPIKTTHVQERVKQNDGTIVLMPPRLWNDKDIPKLQADRRQWLEDTQRLEKNRADLWITIIQNCSNEVLSQAQSDLAAYEALFIF